jgi:hypothetical protein
LPHFARAWRRRQRLQRFIVEPLQLRLLLRQRGICADELSTRVVRAGAL